MLRSRPLGLLLLLCLPGLALGSTMPPQTIAELAGMSDRVVLARLGDSQIRVPGGNVRQMTTITRVEVQEEYRGKGPKALQVVQLGGKHGLWESKVAGDANLLVGQTALLFLRCPDPKAVERCTLVGLAASKLTLITGANGEREVELPRQIKGGPGRRALREVIEEIRRAGPPPAKQERGQR
jgi:hypothetical protein